MVASILRRSASALAAASLLAVVLVGCGTSATSPVENYSGAPKNPVGEVEIGEDGSGGAWLDDGASFAITVSGSSTCPPAASGFAVSGDNSIDVALVEIPGDKACTADFAPHTTVFRTPDDLDPAQDLEVSVGESTFTIPAIE